MHGRKWWWIAGCCLAMSAGCGRSPETAKETGTSPSRPVVRDTEMPPADPATTETQRQTTAALAAFAELVDATQSSDPDAWTTAERKLVDFGASAVPALISRLQDENPLVRELAVQFLAQLGAEAAGAEDTLVKLLADESPVVRVNAASVLLAVNNSTAEAVTTLQDLLSSSDQTVRLTAAVSLVGLETPDLDAMTALTELLHARDWSVRLTAVQTLGRLGDLASGSLSAIQSLQEDDRAEVRRAAALALKQLESPRPEDRQTIPASGTEAANSGP